MYVWCGAVCVCACVCVSVCLCLCVSLCVHAHVRPLLTSRCVMSLCLRPWPQDSAPPGTLCFDRFFRVMCAGEKPHL